MPISDRTVTIRASVKDVQFSLLLSIALVVMVIFLFLRRFWPTFIASVTVPLALAGTAGAMYLLDYSIDNLSLMAVTISVGFVVDDAIVVIENVYRFIELGDSPMDAALKGARQIGFTVVSMSTSLVAVFIPLLFMGGLIGRLFHEFAVTLTLAILVSGVIALTLTPMLCSRFLKAEKDYPGAGPVLPVLRKRIQFLSGRLFARPEMGIAASDFHVAGVGVHAGWNGISLHQGAEGFRAAAGHRNHDGHDGSRAGRFLRDDGEIAEPGGANRPG